MRLLITRPEHDARRTAATLHARGHTAVVVPFMHIEALSGADLGDGSAAILITSANAATAIASHASFPSLRTMPVFAVGQRSAQAMQAAGFTDVTSADGNADDLARLVGRRVKPGAALLYLAGENLTGDLAGDLRAQNFAVRTVVVYRARAATTLPPAAADALAAGVDGVLHFSRRSAETYINVASGAGLLASALKPTHFCLSAHVAEPLARAGATILCVAARPEEAAMIELVEMT